MNDKMVKKIILYIAKDYLLLDEYITLCIINLSKYLTLLNIKLFLIGQ